MLIAFRADASAMIGGGHVMRCLALADALAARGAQTVFLTSDLPSGLAQRLREQGHEVRSVGPPVAPPAATGNWDDAPADAEYQRQDAAAASAALGGRADWLVVDHYRLDATWETAMRGAAGRILTIDDLANRPHDCDLLLDQTAGRAGRDYAGLVPGTARVLAGAGYALLRPEFAEARPAALARRRSLRAPETLMVSIGATDNGGCTAPVLAAFARSPDFRRADVVLAGTAPSRAEVERIAAGDARIRLHLDSREMAALMREADLAIGASGTSNWERCSLGLPAILLVVAQNQRFSAEQLESIGAAVTAASPEAAIDEARALLRAPERLAQMSAAAAALVDGLGTERVAEAMLGPQEGPATELAIRFAGPEDSERLWLWRNDPLTRQLARTREPISWQAHEAWFSRRLRDEDCLLMLVEQAGVPVGMVRFDREPDGGFLVSINLAPTARGAGVGTRALALARQALAERCGEVALRADILGGNVASERIFLANGFSHAGGPSEGAFERYVRPPADDAAEAFR